MVKPALSPHYRCGSALKFLARLELWRSSLSRIGPLGKPLRGEAEGLVLDGGDRQSRLRIQDLRPDVGAA